MGILTKYLLRAHAGPFLFAFSALTGLLFLNAVAQRMENLVGKGLSWSVIGEFLLLSLPHTVALTLPMAILVSVLYTFSQLTAGNEITAMSAGGVKPIRLMLPLLGVGAILALGMLYFNDEVLPEANHRLKTLILDLGRKSPTLNLREQVVNQIDLLDRAGAVYLTARFIDQEKNELEEVVIYDLSDPTARRTTYADRGVMQFNRAQTDLYLTLYGGVVHETRNDREGGFSRSRFQRQIVPLRGVGTELERRQGGGFRSDREMSLILLDWEIGAQKRLLESIEARSLERSREAVEQALGTPIETCAVPGSAACEQEDFSLRPPRTSGISAGGQPGRPMQRVERDPVTRELAFQARTNVNDVEAAYRNIDRYRVEWHKKFSIAYACLVFVLIGAPLAIRFPRGGVGMVIAISVGIFAVYWAGLIGGENFADEGKIPPWIAMWAANILFTVAGVWLVVRMGRETATNRGGGVVEELIWRTRDFVDRVRGRIAPA